MACRNSAIGTISATDQDKLRSGFEPLLPGFEVVAFGDSLFAVGAAEGLAWARQQRNAEVIDAFPRYLPRSLHWIVGVPIAREFASWNLLLVLRRRRPR